jgi:excisionase family DNA binding protein
MRKMEESGNGPELDQLMTVEEASRRLSVTKARCYELIRRKILPAVELGRQKRISERAMRRFIKRGGKGLGEEKSRH